jgi:hypothetical protein
MKKIISKITIKRLRKKLKNLDFDEQIKLLENLVNERFAEDYGKSPDGRYRLFIVSDQIAIFADLQERNFRVIEKRNDPKAFKKVLAAVDK